MSDSSDSDDSSSGEGFFSKVGSFFDFTKPRGNKVAEYLDNVLVEDAEAKFVRGFKFRPDEKLIMPFSCNLVSRNELVDCTGFLSDHFVCFLGQMDRVDDRGHKVLMRVVIPLRTVERILPICVVKGIYELGEKVDAIMLNTNAARHQVVWIDEFDAVLPRLRKAWEAANSPERADDSLPVSLVLNPEFASMSASSADESSPKSDRRVLRLAAIEVADQDQEDAVSDEYDSEHAESLLSIERVAVRPAASVENAPSPAKGGAAPDKITEAVSPSWSDVKI